MLENLARLTAAIEATGRDVWGVQITHPSGYTGPTHYHLTFYPTAAHSLNKHGRRIAGTSDRIWGRDVENMIAKISTFRKVERSA